MNHESMKEALRRKKHGALDITILLGHPGEHQGLPLDPNSGHMDMANVESPEDEKREVQEMDMAPDTHSQHDGGDYGHGAEHPDEAQDKSLIHEELKKATYGRGGFLSHKKKK